MKKNQIMLTAMHSYDNCHCVSIEEFKADLKTLRRINKYISHTEDDVKIRLTLNNIIISYNLFGLAATDLLFASVDAANWDKLLAYLIPLDRISADYSYQNLRVLSELKPDTELLYKVSNI